jgi:hypothetical protein
MKGSLLLLLLDPGIYYAASPDRIYHVLLCIVLIACAASIQSRSFQNSLLCGGEEVR